MLNDFILSESENDFPDDESIFKIRLSKVTLFKALLFIRKAWDDVTVSVIVNSWSRALKNAKIFSNNSSQTRLDHESAPFSHENDDQFLQNIAQENSDDSDFSELEKEPLSVPSEVEVNQYLDGLELYFLKHEKNSMHEFYKFKDKIRQIRAKNVEIRKTCRNIRNSFD